MRKFLLALSLIVIFTIFLQSGVQAKVYPADFVGPLQQTDVRCPISGAKWLKDIGIENGLIVPCSCLDSFTDQQGSPCGLNEVFQTIINVSKIILGLTGSAALLMFTYGGVMFIISTGNAERIQKAKQILVAAAVGIVIIFSAWIIVNFVISALTGGEVGVPLLFGKPWAEQQ